MPCSEYENYLDELSLWGMNMVAFNFVQYANLRTETRAIPRAQQEIIAHANS